MPDVVGLVLRLGARLPEELRHPVQVAERVAKDVVARGLQVLGLPFGHLGAVTRAEDAEVERAAVEGGHLGAALGHHPGSLLDRHADPAPAGGLGDRVAALAHSRQHLLEQPEVGYRLARVGFAHVQVNDRGSGLACLHRRLDDLLRRDRNGLALAGHAHAPGHGAGQEDGLEAHRAAAWARGRSRAGERGTIESSRPPATTTSTHRLAEKEPVTSRAAPSRSGPRGSDRVARPQHQAHHRAGVSGVAGHVEGQREGERKGRAYPRAGEGGPDPARIGERGYAQRGQEERPRSEAEPLASRPEAVGQVGHHQSAGKAGDAHHPNEGARRLGAPTALLEGVGHPRDEAVVDDRLQGEHRHKHPHHPPAPR